MVPEILDKITSLLRRRALTESQVVHLMVLARKLAEDVPKPDRRDYTLLRFYCDWCVHRGLDRSAAGAEIVAQLHKIVTRFVEKGDSSDYPNEVTAALSFDRAREEFNALMRREAGSAATTISATQWDGIVRMLAEIVSACPVSFPTDGSPTARLAVAEARANPFKGGRVIERMAIEKAPSRHAAVGAVDGQVTYRVVLTTNDNVRIVSPLQKRRSALTGLTRHGQAAT